MMVNNKPSDLPTEDRVELDAATTYDLFGGALPDPAPQPDPYEGMGQDARRTARRRERIARGVHPVAPHMLAGNGKTCGDCAHLILKDGPMIGAGRGKYWKCTKLLHHGRGPDMRKSWPACTLFEERS